MSSVKAGGKIDGDANAVVEVPLRCFFLALWVIWVASGSIQKMVFQYTMLFLMFSDNDCDGANFWDGNDSDSDDDVRSCFDEAGSFKQWKNNTVVHESFQTFTCASALWLKVSPLVSYAGEGKYDFELELIVSYFQSLR